MASARLEFPRGEDAKTEFVLAHFTHGHLAKEDGLKFSLQDVEEVASAKKKKKAKKRKLVAETDRMTYAGHNYGDEIGPDTDKCKYMVAVYDKKTQKAFICKASMCYLKPQFPGEEVPEDTTMRLTVGEKLDQLTSAFGSTKKKRAMEARKKNKIESSELEHAVGSAADQALKNVDVSTLQPGPGGDAVQASSVLPPFSMDAQKPADVYKLHDYTVIPPEEMTALETPAQVIVGADRKQVAEWKEAKKFPSFIQSQLVYLPIESKARMHRACLLTYIDYLIFVYNLKNKDLKVKDPLPESVPLTVRKLILMKFTLETRTATGKSIRCIPARLKDKLVTHILVLALILEEFSLEYSRLQQDLKLGAGKILTYVRSLGCQTSKSHVETGPGLPKTQVQLANLTVPLKFPELTRKKPKDRR